MVLDVLGLMTRFSG
jgi:hypothetical protein